jgi:P27 family predicted phage terminase small subunit
MGTPKAPKGLSAEARKWWRTITSEYDLGESSYLLLLSAMECFDRMRAAQVVIEVEGLTVEDRNGRVAAHPCVGIERDARAGLLRNLKAMGLDMEPINPVGRPAGR